MRATISFLILIIAALPFAALAQDHDGPDPSVFEDRAAWASDLEVLYDSLREIHPDYTHAHGADEWDAAYAALQAEIPNLSWPEFVGATARFVALSADGHTNVYPLAVPGDLFQWRYPVTVYQFQDGLYVTRAAPEAANIVGQRVTLIGDRPADEAMRDLAAMISGGNAMWGLNWAPQILRMPGYAAAAGLTDADMLLSLTVENGSTATFTMQESVDNAELVNLFDAAGSDAGFPQWWTEERPYSFTYLEDKNAVYVLYQAVESVDEEPIDAFADRLFAFIDEHDVERLIIDVRNNGGGDNTFNAPLVHGVIASDLNHPGGVYVITGRQTFSAAQNFVNWMERHTQALFVGEPTGGTPNHYGDAEFIPLPNTQIPVIISTFRWFDSFPNDPRPWTRPDIPAPLTFADFVAGHDPALEAALSFDASGIAYEPFTANRWRRDTQFLGWDVPLIGLIGRFNPDGSSAD